MIILTKHLLNWEETPLNDLLLCLETGARPKGGVDRYKTGLPSLGGEHLTADGKFNLKNLKFIPEYFAEKLLRGKISQGDVLIVKDGATTGKCVLVQNNFQFDRAYVNEHVFLCRFLSILDSRFFAYYLRSDKGQKRILNNFRGAAQGGIPQSFADNTLIPVAPVNEQKRIADKLDTLLAKVDACREHLERVPQILKRFRQAVLAAATSGRLTEEWREEHNKWETCTLGSVITDIRYGTSKKSFYDLNNGTPVLRIPNIGDRKIDPTDLKFTQFDDKEIKNLSLKSGDLLLIRSNGSVELVGKVAVVSPEFEGYMYAGYLIRLRFDITKINPYYINLYLISPAIRKHIEFTTRSTSGVNNINSEEVKAIPLNLPSLAEQHEIVRRVELLFAYADKLETRYQAARSRVDSLTPSLLAKAFRGELVPQDANDEAAAVLLERIRDSKGLPSPDPKGFLPDL
ncbi:MAG: restriction endonuclease subunit S [Chloroflexota bacterium]